MRIVGWETAPQMALEIAPNMQGEGRSVYIYLVLVRREYI